MTSASNLQSMAAALFDGGWKAEERAELIAEYDLSSEVADQICDLLLEYAQKED